jgi:hypothetical protein
MLQNTYINFVSHTTISIKNLYYDLVENQFILNSENIHDLQYIWWHGRNNPSETGKHMIYKKLDENEIIENLLQT